MRGYDRVEASEGVKYLDNEEELEKIDAQEKLSFNRSCVSYKPSYL